VPPTIKIKNLRAMAQAQALDSCSLGAPFAYPA